MAFNQRANILITQVVLLIVMMPVPGIIVAQTKFSASCAKCDMNLLPFPHDEEFSESEILMAFCTVHESCSSHVEFSEVSNEILFKIFLIEPKLALKILSKNPNLDLNYIVVELSQPVNDEIDVKRIYSEVEKVKGYDKMKERVLRSLKVAISNQ